MTVDFLIAPKLLRLHFWTQPFFNRAAVNFWVQQLHKERFKSQFETEIRNLNLKHVFPLAPSLIFRLTDIAAIYVD